MLTADNITMRLVQVLPEFASVVDEHQRHNDSVLPHVLFGDLTRFVLAARQEQNAQLVGRSLSFLDEALRVGDDDVKNLVAVSFVENIPPWDTAQASFIATWPPTLQEEARRQSDSRPGSR